MAEFFDSLDDKHIDFIRAQRMFFIATAPLDGEGFPNLSPKGYDALHVLGSDRLAYVDLLGSGNQTASHLAQGGRATLMFCGFESQALILRVYGRGEAHLAGSEGFEAIRAEIDADLLGPGTRQIFEIRVEKVQTSCGWGVPRYAFEGERPTLLKYIDGVVERGEIEVALAVTSAPQENV